MIRSMHIGCTSATAIANRAAATLLLAAMVWLGGCRIVTPAAADRLAGGLVPALAEQSWPQRSASPDPLIVRAGGEWCSLHDCGKLGQGVLYRVEMTPNAQHSPGQEIRVVITPEHSPRKLTFTGRVHTNRPSMSDPARGESYFFASYPMQTLTFTPPDGQPQEIEFQSVDPQLTYLNVRSPAATPQRGTIIFLTSLAGFSDGEEDLMRTLLERGWGVIAVTPALDAIHKRTYDIQSQRLEASAILLARDIDQSLAQQVYAVEAILQHLSAAQPEVLREPLVTIGCSAGAIGLPAVVARMPERISAAVLIGGGANVFEAVTRSDLMGSQVRILWDGRRPSKSQFAQLGEIVFQHTALDPYKTSAFLRGKPVLMLHAKFDRIVPAHTGQLLYEQLGRPERWSYPFGHVLLFWWLPNASDDIADWIEQAIENAVPAQAISGQHPVDSSVAEAGK